jgi:hypothetical protein
MVAAVGCPEWRVARRHRRCIGLLHLGSEIRYRFVTVSIASAANAEDRQLAERLRQEVTTKTFSGPYSPIYNLDYLAKRGVITQVGFEWLEPSGWSFKDHDELDILNQNEIETSEIVRRVSSHIYHARLPHAITFFALAVTASIAALVLGIGVAWIRRGFASRHT